jgi:P27 family predicted phage terminase small subunit
MRKTSNEMKALRGTLRTDRARSKPALKVGAKCPSYLDKVAKAEWKRVGPELEQQGVLTEASAQILASYCSSFAHFKASEEAIQRDGLVINITSSTRTGMTVKPVPNPAVRNYQTFKRMMLESARLFGIDPLNAGKIEPQSQPEQAPRTPQEIHIAESLRQLNVEADGWPAGF